MADAQAEAGAHGWWARFPPRGEPGRPVEQLWVAVLGDQFPAGSVVDQPPGPRPSDWLMSVRAQPGSGRVCAVEVALPGVPALWFVELPEPAAAPPACTFLAFSDPRHPDGTLLTEAQARTAGIGGAQQVAALRWWPGSGLVHQIYVGPGFRRRGLALKLAMVGYGVQRVRGLPELHGDGRRTDDGEAWSAGLPAWAAGRLAERTQVLPAMTPGAG